MITLNVNGKTHRVNVAPEVPLLWVLREHLQLSGTKYGCGIGMCGACTVHIDDKAERSCQIKVKDAEGKKITTIEGLPEDHPVKEAWIAEQVPQCGYCQPGQIMQAAALLSQIPDPSDDQIGSNMNGNLCRCGTYQHIHKAIKTAARRSKSS